MWFMTHAHHDHFGGLLWLLQNGYGSEITIKELRYSFPPYEWLRAIENECEGAQIGHFLQAVESAGLPVKPLTKGDILSCGGMEFEVLGDCSRYADYTNVNDTSIPFFR